MEQLDDRLRGGGNGGQDRGAELLAELVSPVGLDRDRIDARGQIGTEPASQVQGGPQRSVVRGIEVTGRVVGQFLE